MHIDTAKYIYMYTIDKDERGSRLYHKTANGQKS
jgi:hypothetical protein